MQTNAVLVVVCSIRKLALQPVSYGLGLIFLDCKVFDLSMQHHSVDLISLI